MINISDLTELCIKLGCKVHTACYLKDYTTFKIGGRCSAIVDAASAEDAAELVKYFRANNIKYTVLGRGSNILASDEGYNGVILHLGGDFSKVDVYGTKLTAQSGASLSAVCVKAQQNGLSGMENLYGIPGSVGGGLFMNAGAYGTEMKDVVVSAEYIDENGVLKVISVDEMMLSYRRSIFSERNCIVTSVTFALTEGDPNSIKESMNECMRKRTSKQPLEYPSAGSTFKRPEGSYASLLIEKCGLKGQSVGGAQISEKHSGFVINTGNATFADVMELCEKVKNTVMEKTGYSLELEPIILK